MKPLRLQFCVVVLTVMTGCATCRSRSAALSSPAQDECTHPFWEWFGEQVVQNLLNWSIGR
jgi:hypothetical protein